MLLGWTSLEGNLVALPFDEAGYSGSKKWISSALEGDIRDLIFRALEGNIPGSLMSCLARKQGELGLAYRYLWYVNSFLPSTLCFSLDDHLLGPEINRFR